MELVHSLDEHLCHPKTYSVYLQHRFIFILLGKLIYPLSMYFRSRAPHASDFPCQLVDIFQLRYLVVAFFLESGAVSESDRGVSLFCV